jgi:transcriptional regulator with XRE-family HTH domain
MNYSKLKGRIREVFHTQRAFAEAIGLSVTSVNQRLSGKVHWKTPEIAKACEVLHIPLADAWQYFFTLKV